MAIGWKADNDGERGPGWYDVWSYARALEGHWDASVEFEVHASGLAQKEWGLYITARLKEYPTRFGCSGYGRGWPGTGPKTMAAALFHALLKLDHDMARLDMAPPVRCDPPEQPSADE